MEELESRYELARLISRRLSGAATPEEEERLQKWCEDEESHKREYDVICGRLAVDLRNTEHPDLHKAWKGIVGKLPPVKRLFWSWRPVAAVCAGVVLLIGLGVRLLLSEELNVAQEDGTEGVVLILNNGEKVELEKRLEEVIDGGKGTKIRIGEKVMSYHAGEKAQKQELNTVQVPRGGEYRLILADGTQVWMNAESQLTYPVQFTGNTREVVMKGEVCFEVAKNAGRPFVVKAGQVEVTVTGTLFNIEAYPENEEVKTTLVNGRVEVWSGSSREILVPNEQAVVNKEGKIRVNEVFAEDYIGWTKGEFRFTRTRLEEVMTRLARWYDKEVIFAVPDLKNARFTLNIKRYDDINEVLSKIEKTGRVHFRLNGQRIVVE